LISVVADYDEARVDSPKVAPRSRQRVVAANATRLTDTERVSDKHARLVYSTATAGKCPVCGWPQRDCQCSDRRAASEPVPARLVAKLRVEKTGRGGKTVTVVYGLPQNAVFLRELAQDLKRACGTGGTTTDDGVELQGDLRDRVRDALAKKGYAVKG
jgi:translation initiation factor 1